MRSSRLLPLALVSVLAGFSSEVVIAEIPPAARTPAQKTAVPPAWVGVLWRLQPASFDTRASLFVCGVVRSGPAGKAGLRGDDLIEAIDGAPVPLGSKLEVLDFFAGLDTTRAHVFTVRRGQGILEIPIPRSR